MNLIAFDTETALIRPGAVAPRLVCVAIGDASGADLYHAADAEAWTSRILEALEDPQTITVNQNIAFDFAVLVNEWRRLRDLGEISLERFDRLTAAIWRAYREDRIGDPMISALLVAIAKGEPASRAGRKAAKLHGLSLADLVSAYLGETVQGKAGADVWRLRYGSLLYRADVSRWPAAAREYATLDPVYAARVWIAIRRAAGGQALPSEGRTVRASWALTLQGAWGVRTDPAYVEAHAAFLERVVQEAEPLARAAGWLREDGTRDTAAQAARIREGLEARGRWDPKLYTTPTGRTKADRDTLEAAGLPDLVAWARSDKARKEISTFVPTLRTGTEHAICPSWWPCVESERISGYKPNLTFQAGREVEITAGDPDPRIAALVRAEGREVMAIGVRSAYVPRPGRLLAAVDYSTAELRAFAQHALRWFGRSRMAEVLIREAEDRAAGRPAADLHVAFAAEILGVSLETAIGMHAAGDPAMKAARKLAKACNFGLLGGMYARRFAAQAEGSGIDLTHGGTRDPIREADRLRRLWLRTWPEVPLYFKRIDALLEAGGGRFRSRAADGLIRGGMGYTDGANHHFQGAVAQWLKDALFRVSFECYQDRGSVLYGSRPVITPHDEIIAEVLEDRAPEAADRIAAIMVSAASALAPDVPIVAEPSLMRRWSKAAEPVRDAAGRLQTWEPPR